jgi:hypothetical protein
VETKICSKCKEEKDICEFGKDSSRKGGLSYLCKECLIKKSKTYKELNKGKVLESYCLYRTNNKTKMKKSRKEYINNNKEKVRIYRNYYSNKKRKESEIIRLSENLRRRINHILKLNNITKKNKTFDIVGCSPQFLKECLEQKFTEGMSWELIGQHIHIDHIIPLSSANTEEEVYKLCHYTNLQPLWAFDNLSKGSKIL